VRVQQVPSLHVSSRVDHHHPAGFCMVRSKLYGGTGVKASENTSLKFKVEPQVIQDGAKIKRDKFTINSGMNRAVNLFRVLPIDKGQV